MTTVITNARIFDGERLLSPRTVVIDGPVIISVSDLRDSSATSHADAELVDGQGMTLLPGLVDAHTHTSPDSLRLALTFRVTTELQMGGVCTAGRRDNMTGNDELAGAEGAHLNFPRPAR